MQTFAIDFETYYDDKLGILTQGMVPYIEHPDFDPYMVSIVGPNVEYSGPPDAAPWHAIEGHRAISHNAAFDTYIWLWMTQHRGRAWGRGPREWHCTADMCAYLKAPRALAGAVKALLHTETSKDIRRWAKGKNWAAIQAAGKGQEMIDYALMDSRLCLRLWTEFSDLWPEWERVSSQLTRYWGWRGVTVDREQLEHGLRRLDEHLMDCLKKLPWCWDLNECGPYPLTPEADGEPERWSPYPIPFEWQPHYTLAAKPTPLSMNKLHNYCSYVGLPKPPSRAMTSAAAERWLEAHGEQHPVMMAMRDYGRGNALFQKLLTVRAGIRDRDNTLPYDLKYYGAHTGRWSGGGQGRSINMQNLHKDELFDVSVRPLFIPSPGCKMIICDLSQIEPRCLAWLSGDVAFLRFMHQGMSPYEAHARVALGWTGGNLKTENPGLYALAKAQVLALGYGAGAAKFKVMAKQYSGLDLTENQSSVHVNSFREQRALIPKFWRMLESGMRRATPGPYEIELPSGRALRYINIRRTAQGLTAQPGENQRPVSTWGGKLCENVTQAVALDVFKWNLIRVHNADLGGRVLWTVHDEVVYEAPAAIAESVAKEVERLLCQPVPWMPGLPIAAEAQVTDRYLK